MKVVIWTFHEMKLQWKNGFYGMYLLVNIVYILMLVYVPSDYKEMATILLLVSDPTFLGMMFVGSILLLEKNQGIPKGIGISPLGSFGYILGKVVSLLVIAVITGICIMLAGDMVPTGWQLLGIILGGSLFTMIGIMLGCFSSNINRFIALFAGGSTFFALPVLSFYHIFDQRVFGAIPTYSILKLLAYGSERGGNSLSHVIYLLMWLVVVYLGTARVVEKRLFVI